jgi:hypothetical protein
VVLLLICLLFFYFFLRTYWSKDPRELSEYLDAIVFGPKNVLAIEEDRQGRPRAKSENKNNSLNADLSDSDHLLQLPISPSSQIKSPSASLTTSISLGPDKDLNFDVIEL